MTEERDRPEKEPKEPEEKNETGEQEHEPVEREPGEDWEKEKQRGKEIVNKALDRVRNKLEER